MAKKNLVSGPMLSPLAEIWAQNVFFSDFTSFFFKNLALLVTRYHGQLLSCTISEETNDPILRKVSDEQTDRQTDESKKLMQAWKVSSVYWASRGENIKKIHRIALE